MIKSLLQHIASPFMIGLLSLGSFFTSATKLDVSKYSTEGLELCYDVPLPEEVSPVNMWSYTPIPLLGDSYLGFKEALAFKESRGDYGVVNQFGYLGKLFMDHTAEISVEDQQAQTAQHLLAFLEGLAEEL